MNHTYGRFGLPLTLLAIVGACSDSPASSSSGPVIELRIAHAEPAADRQAAEFDGETLYLEDQAVLTDSDLIAVRPHRRGEGLILDMEFEDSSAERLRAALGRSIGARLALLIGPDIRAAPVIASTETGARLQTVLNVNHEEADRIAEIVRTRWP